MKRKIYSAALITLIGFLGGCFPEGAQYVDELDLVYSVYDKGYDFQGKSTYSLPTQIVKITGDPTQQVEYINPLYATPILAEIAANMTNLGWTQVDISANPDIEFLPGAWSTTTIIVGGYWGSYWCWYYPYYCTGGGWYYPYYPTTSYTTGTLLMTMVDHKNASTDDSKRVVWTGAINGLLQGTYNVDRLNKNIYQTFTQSPYLKTN